MPSLLRDFPFASEVFRLGGLIQNFTIFSLAVKGPVQKWAVQYTDSPTKVYRQIAKNLANDLFTRLFTWSG